MIRLVFSVDPNNMAGATTQEGQSAQIEALPEGMWEQVKKAAGNGHLVVGHHTYERYKSGEFTDSRKLFVLSRQLEFTTNQSGVVVVRDYRELLEKFHDRKETITVLGGLEVLRLFLPYAKEMCVVVLNQEIPGDMVFDEWQASGFDLMKTEQWEQGTTYYYVK